jgi:outer membrane protein TolC
MLNPIHGTLNQLLTAHGYNAVYPTDIPNEVIPFLRPAEHDTKVRVVQPLFQPGIYYNLKIKKDIHRIEKAKVDAFKNQLVADIKTAYFTYLKMVKVNELLKNTRGLLEENLRLSRSLFENHKVTEEVVFRSKAEISQLDRQQTEAEKNCLLAVSYFNFLLNRSLDEQVEIFKYEAKPVPKSYNLDELLARAMGNRAEFRQVEAAIAAAGHTVGLHKSNLLPNINAVFDYGFQGVRYRFSEADDYWMGTLLLNWNLFKGGQDRAKRMQALYRKKQALTQRQELEKRIWLQVTEAYRNLEVAQKAIISTEDTLRSSKEAFDILSRKYRQGMVPQVEYTQARNDFTTAGINNIIAVYDYYIKEAELESVAGLVESR